MSYLQFVGMTGLLLLGLWTQPAVAESEARNLDWTAPQHFRIVLTVDARGRVRSQSPAAVELDFQSHLGSRHVLDEHSVDVVAVDDAGRPRVFDDSRPETERCLVPHRIDRLFGSDKVTLNFVVPDHTCRRYAVYFDTVQSGLGRPNRYAGLVGDGDRFREDFQKREIAASHFDQFVDFDGDGDWDLFQGGVEPFVDCYENLGGNRMAARGRLANGGQLFRLPCSKQNRSWLTVAFFDVDGDGDQDFFPSFNDGPDGGRIVFYRNTTAGPGQPLTFSRVGPLQTVTGEPLAGGAQAGGWFPSIVFVTGWDGETTRRLDALVGSNHHCWLYRGLGTNADGSPQFAAAVAVQAGGTDINLPNPRFDTVDIDADGDLDLFAGAQPGPVWWFENRGTRAKPALAAGRVVAWEGRYLIADAHSGVKVADFDGDGLLDLAAGRFWERTDLNRPDQPREFGGFFRNVGSRSAPRFVRDTERSPFTEQFQSCDAVRQNCVRAFDWDHDGKSDLLAGDTDGFVWFFRNRSSQRFSLFARAKKIQAGGQPLSVAKSGGHARFDVCDWDHDGRRDLLIADGQGTLSFFRNSGGNSQPVLEAGQQVLADGKPVQGAARASVLVCDWDNDGRQDIVFADEKGFRWHRNVGTADRPVLAAPQTILFNGRTVNYVRPNLGSFVDWDGDGKRDFIGCHFENSIRLYRNLGSGMTASEPQFSDPEGIVLVAASSPQIISGAEAVDWNGDGDVDLLTGQGHGGSGLRFFERDWIEDELHGTHPLVTSSSLETKPASP